MCLRYLVPPIAILFLSCLTAPAYPQVNSHDVSDFSFSGKLNQQRKIIENDKILINIRKVPELGGGFNVDQAGMVELQLLGKVKAAGLKPSEFEKVLAELYGRDYLQDPFIRIEIVNSFTAEDIIVSEGMGLSKAISLDEDVIDGQEQISQSPLPSNSESALSFVPIENSMANEQVSIIFEPVSIQTEEVIFSDPFEIPKLLPLEVGEQAEDVYSLRDSETVIQSTAEIIERVTLKETGTVINTLISKNYQPLLEAHETVKHNFSISETNWTFDFDPRAFMQFLEDGKIAGFTGCNNFFANYSSGESLLTIKFIAITLNECFDIKDGEFQEALESITNFELFEPDKLSLKDKDNEVVFIMRKGF